MNAKVFSAAILGVSGHIIEVEASRENALPQIHITGLPNTVVRESRDRIRSCLLCVEGAPPTGRVTLHLSPANFSKSGSHYDLGMALSLLGAEGILDAKKLKGIGVIGELSLDGRIRKVPGAVTLIESLDRDKRVKTLLVPEENILEARMVLSPKVRLVGLLSECIELLKSEKEIPKTPLMPIERTKISRKEYVFDQVIGQGVAKRALEIALAGHHHLLMIGPPGVGKSFLAGTAEELLPEMSPAERIELHKIYGVSGVTEGVPENRPFRTPHHSISQAGLLGGGSRFLSPGEISFSHRGVLFLDELPEFRRDSLEGLREPLQTGQVHHHRSQFTVTLPSKFILLAAMNPCPCGYSSGNSHKCRCSFLEVTRYRRRLSGPFLDRLDLLVWMQESPTEAPSLKGAEVASRIAEAQARKAKRGSPLPIDPPDQNWLETAAKVETISHRTRNKVLAVAETIADLEGASTVNVLHLQEAWGFRCSNLFSRFCVS